MVSLPNGTITELSITELFHYGLLLPNVAHSESLENDNTESKDFLRSLRFERRILANIWYHKFPKWLVKLLFESFESQRNPSKAFWSK